MKKRLVWLGPILALELTAGCVGPTGSLARPVEQPGKGTLLGGGGVFVPIKSWGNNGEDLVRQFEAIPAATVEYVLDDGQQVGLGVSQVNYGYSDLDKTYLFSPRWEYRANSMLSMSATMTFGMTPTIATRSTRSLSFYPTFAAHGYLPTGWGGVVLTTDLTPLFWVTRGSVSVAYDCVIPLPKQAKLHIFPEARFDYAGILSNDHSSYATFSPGLSMLLEL